MCVCVSQGPLACLFPLRDAPPGWVSSRDIRREKEASFQHKRGGVKTQLRRSLPSPSSPVGLLVEALLQDEALFPTQMGP